MPTGGDTRRAGWYVLETQRNRERVAHRFLAQRGVPGYLPMILQWPRPAVGSAVAPMFPGYLFVHAVLEDAFTRIAWTPGVKAFVRVGAEPAAVDESVIEYLRSRQDPDGVIRCPQGVPQGSEVRIIDGPFCGLSAIVQECLPARERIRVLLEIMQRDTPVEMPDAWVRVA